MAHSSHSKLTPDGPCIEECPECGWQFRDLPALPPLGRTPVLVKCHRHTCRRWSVILLRVFMRGGDLAWESMGIQRLHGRDEGSLRQALAGFPTLDPDEIDYHLTLSRAQAARRRA